MALAAKTVLSDQDRAFLQRRVAWFGLFGGALGLAFWLLRLALMVGFAQWDELWHPGFWMHCAGWVSLGTVWLLCRRGNRSGAFIRTTESIGLVLACLAYIAMGAVAPPAARADLIVILALTHALVGRALWVPSTGGRTLLVGVAVGIPLLISIYLSMLHLPPVVSELMSGRPTSPESMSAVLTIFAAAWWLATTALSTLASRTLYGLRREVRHVRHLGQYYLEEKLGEGGMGVVYRARHGMLRRPTAIKLLRTEGEEGRVARFEREVQQTARLTHPNTITVFDYGRTPEGVFYYAMELLDGFNLQELIDIDGPQPAARVIRFLMGAASSLAEAHGIGLIHRDIKPANIIVCSRGGEYDVPKLVDFGLVKELGPKQDSSASLSHTDMLTGTPQYIPPEAIENPEKVDTRSDLYSLGAVGYFLITGTHVFQGNNLVEICSHHMHTDPEKPSVRLGAQVPVDLEALLLRCLAKSRADRPASAEELRQALAACGDAKDWDNARATAWWKAHESVLRELRQTSSTPGPQTVAVDIEHRSTGR